MKTYVVFVHNKLSWSNPVTVLHWLVRKATQCNWDHVAIVTEKDSLKMVHEATMSHKFRSMKMDECWKKGKYFTMFPVEFIEGWEGRLVRLSRVCRGYDFLSVTIGFLSKWLFGKWPFRQTKKQALKRLFCSEAYGYVAGYEDWKEITTADILKRV